MEEAEVARDQAYTWKEGRCGHRVSLAFIKEKSGEKES
jgi:hypothetical protein